MTVIGGTKWKALAAASALLVTLAASVAVAGAQVSGGNPVLQPWSTTSALPQGRSRNGAVSAGGYVYVIGGVNSAGDTMNTSYYAPVNGDGTVGTWNTTTPLPGNRRTVRPAAYNGYLYFAGGMDGVGFRSEVYYAQIGAGGNLGSWATTTPLPTVSTSHSTLAYNGFLYTVGGNLGPSCVETVRFAPINANATLGAWTTTSPLPDARCGNVEAVTIANGYMYAAGGYNNNNVTRSVYYAQINGNGTLGPWQTNATSLQTAREYNSLEALNGYLYAIGGQPQLSGNATAAVEVAPINANGSVGTWSASTNLPAQRGEPASEVIGGVVYVFGGGTGQSGSSPQSTVYFTRQVSADTTAPTVSVTAPSGGATVSGAVNVTATAGDNVGVVGVQFLLDGAVLGAEDTVAPYGVSWASTGATNGSHTLTARARDAAGNQTTSTPVAVTVNNVVVDTTPPVLSNGLPAGTLAAGTTQTNLQVSTNEAATCRYGTVAGTPYASLVNAFTTTGATSHTTTVAGLANGTAYAFYLRCSDIAGNATTSDFGITFSIAAAADTTAPTVSVTAPSGGATVSGAVNVTATAGDNVGVVGVQFLLDGAVLGAEDTVAPYGVSWASTGATNGSHTLTARARDAAGNQTTSTPVAVTVNNVVVDTTPPVLSNGLPAGTLAAGTTQTNLQVSTNEAATCRYGTVAGTPYASLVNAFTTTGATSHTTTVAGLANGTAYAFYLRCSDIAGNATTSDFGITFSIAAAADTTAPTVSVTAPSGGATVSGAVNVTATAGDNVGVVGVQFLLDGAVLGAEDTVAPYGVSWASTGATNGSHTLTARARDAAGNQTTSTPVAVTVNNVVPVSLLAAYGLNDGSGTAVLNSAPSGSPATLVGGTWTATGRYGGAAVLDGATSRIQSTGNVTLGTSFTYEAWVLNPGIATWETVVTVGANRDLYLTNGVPTFWTGAADLTFGAALPANVWQHLAVTYDGTTMRVYLNGAAYGSPQTVSLGSTTAAIQVGAYPYGGGNVDNFGGTIDEVRVYNRALSAAEILTDRDTPI